MFTSKARSEWTSIEPASLGSHEVKSDASSVSITTIPESASEVFVHVEVTKSDGGFKVNLQTH